MVADLGFEFKCVIREREGERERGREREREKVGVQGPGGDISAERQSCVIDRSTTSF